MTPAMVGHAPGPDVSDRSLRLASLVAGIGLLLMSALAVFANFVVIEGLVTQGDATQTARDISGSEGLFRLGVVSLYVVVVLDVVVAWALWRLFFPVSQTVSMLAAWFRVAYAGVFLVAVSHLAGALDFLDGGPGTAFTDDQRHALALSSIEDFTHVWDAGLVLFGIHLVLIGCLALRSGFIPRFLGALLVLAGVGYVFDSVVGMLAPGSTIEVSMFTFVGEFLLIFWLLFRGRRLAIDSERSVA